MMVDSNHVVSGLQRLFGETMENILKAGCWKWAVMFANKSKGVKIPSCKLSVPNGGGVMLVYTSVSELKYVQTINT